MFSTLTEDGEWENVTVNLADPKARLDAAYGENVAVFLDPPVGENSANGGKSTRSVVRGRGNGARGRAELTLADADRLMQRVASVGHVGSIYCTFFVMWWMSSGSLLGNLVTFVSGLASVVFGIYDFRLEVR